mmetsp:Transcript_13236/g.24801  ORF Transcript_13236/g.24801 Transcript_13236/m.24801 type:complete len:89 (-) Transcript_13236:1183-1449(-)
MGLYLLRREQRTVRLLSCGFMLSLNLMNLYLRFERDSVFRLGLMNCNAGKEVRKIYFAELPRNFQVRSFRAKQEEYDSEAKYYAEVPE